MGQSSPEKQRADAARSRVRNRAFVDALRARTFCAHCGAQPVDWHNPEHVELNRPHMRISQMVGKARAIAAIEAEVARCTPLCRRCHMAEDGRLKRLVEQARQPRVLKPPVPCITCGFVSRPKAHGLCARCYQAAYPRPSRRNTKRRLWRVPREQVVAIREMASARVAPGEIAQRFGLHYSTIRRIVKLERHVF